MITRQEALEILACANSKQERKLALVILAMVDQREEDAQGLAQEYINEAKEKA